MAGNKILVIGDAVEDVFYLSTSTRQSAEVEIPVYDISDVKIYPGAAANIVKSLENLGFEVDFLYGINADMGVPQKCRIYLNSTQVARFDLNDRVDAIWSEFLDTNLKLSYRAVIVADYNKGSVNTVVRDKIVAYCQKFICPLFVHTKRTPALWWTSENELTTMFCNVSEWTPFADQYNLFHRVIRTDGENGVMHISKGKIINDVEALAPRVVDVNGAGDVFMATYIARMLGTSLVQQHVPSALAFASVGSAIAIQRLFTSYVEYQELKEGWYEYNNSKSTASQ